MPKIVYGVLDVHPSHRIESPSPAQQAADDRPDACTQCHIDKTRAWAAAAYDRMFGAKQARQVALEAVSSPAPALSEVERQLFAGDPIQRSLAAAALAREVSASTRSRRLALLLEVMDNDPYPAVRHLAQRSARHLLSNAALLDGYVPETPRAQRSRALSTPRARFPLLANDALAIQTLRAQAQERAIEIGE
jgi:hypothetical protein